MSQVCEFPVHHDSVLTEQADHERDIDRSYSIFCSGERSNIVENYIMIPIDGTGFVVIKEDIEVSGDVK